MILKSRDKVTRLCDEIWIIFEIMVKIYASLFDIALKDEENCNI